MKVLKYQNALAALFLAMLLFTFPACNTSKAVKGGAIGAGVGAAAGAVVGKASGSTALGAILGAGIGGAAGAIIGDYMDRQAKELDENLENAEVERVGEGILLTFDSGLLFDFDEAELRASTRENLLKLTSTLGKYEDTNLRIVGHTDKVGSESYNTQLSQRRARTVADFLADQGIDPTRFLILGQGESEPVADNDTEYGRQQNRRVEVAIYANEELKEAAREGKVGR